MKNLIRKVPLTADKSDFHVVVETPKGSASKFAYDEDTGLFKLKRALPQGMVFPFNFGFFPGTVGDDGDPLDVLVVNEQTLFPGCLVEVRLLGVIEAEQTEKGKSERNDRVIAAAANRKLPSHLENMELDNKTCFELEHFFIAYNKLSGKQFKVLGRKGASAAREILKRAARAFS